MADLKVWSYSHCSTCRRALAWLKSQGHDVELFDITATPPGRDLLSSAMDQFGRRQPLFNTSGQSYRALGASTVKAMTDGQALDALAQDGKLIKRPFLLLPDGRVLVGFNEAAWSEALPG